jgi:hypothetical protein
MCEGDHIPTDQVGVAVPLCACIRGVFSPNILPGY